MEEKKIKKPVYKRWWFWVLVVAIVLGAFVPEDVEQSDNVSTVVAESTKAPAVSTPEPTEDVTASWTLGQKNAVKKAYDYLDYSYFSAAGLQDQLEFEGFTAEEAAFAVENCGADWKEQAAGKAQAYLDIMAMSKDGLIDQLIFEGFTREEAEYGVAAVGY